MTFFHSARLWLRSHRAYFPDLIRIYLGIGLAIKGIFLLMHPSDLAAVAASIPENLVRLVPFIHIAGGAMMAVGIATRIAAIIQIPVVAGALITVNSPYIPGMQAREAFEFSALTLFLLVLIAVWGGGPLSLDKRLQAKAAPRLQSAWLAEHSDLFLDLVRAYLGVGLFVKGWYILHHQAEFQNLIEHVGTMSILLLSAAHYVIPAHFAGGAMLFVGLATRYAALAQIPLLFGALFYVYLPRFSTLELRENMEFTGLVLFLLSIFALYGSGRYSVDHLLEKSEDHNAFDDAKASHSAAPA